ncbi:uncharacterized protein LOC130449965 [Diorhabda sublineata]|uniref:uncharacterized protein LOC130449965 n=1 Tax=Diorhabda sublineata TaxID=1163346 RepID=UPI0024E05432|nr:uncharacterized protein LOC130449965 [Diorhabda sublineata]
MESVHLARQRYRKYPLLLSKCGKDAVQYATCVLKKDNVNMNDCKKEFMDFKNCLQKAAASLKTRI